MLVILILLSSSPLFGCSYLLPYAPGSDHRILQGNFGKYSHLPPLQYGVDFDMNPGTYIHAARAGEVIDFREDSNSGGPSKKFLKKANYLKIKHSDGSIAFYAHLLHKGVLVKKAKKSNPLKLLQSLDVQVFVMALTCILKFTESMIEVSERLFLLIF